MPQFSTEEIKLPPAAIKVKAVTKANLMSILFGQGKEIESMQPGRYAPPPGGFPHPLSRRDDFDAALSAVVAATLRSREPLLGGGPQPSSPHMSPQIPLSLMYSGLGQTRSMLAATLAVQQQRKRDAEEMSLFSLILRQRALAAAATAPLSHRVPTPGAALETAQAESVKSSMFARGPSSLHSIANPAGASPSPQEATKILKALGSRVRTKSSAYVDASLLPDPGADVIVRGGRNEYFPEKVYIMLEETEKAGQTDIVGWLSHGRAWKIHDQDRFVNEIMPVYFGGLSKYTRYGCLVALLLGDVTFVSANFCF